MHDTQLMISIWQIYIQITTHNIRNTHSLRFFSLEGGPPSCQSQVEPQTDYTRQLDQHFMAASPLGGESLKPGDKVRGSYKSVLCRTARGPSTAGLVSTVTAYTDISGFMGYYVLCTLTQRLHLAFFIGGLSPTNFWGMLPQLFVQTDNYSKWHGVLKYYAHG